ncbi:MAG TPA: hypothetical protein VHJ82_00655 [Actinomycetota bacterium]|nr:hypothetical protein [Actinomycetota bacterium]
MNAGRLGRAAVVVVLVAGSLAGTAPARGQVGCSWPFLLDDERLNFAFPDDSSTYWMTRFTSLPQSRLIINGQYPHARYFSFHVYDEAGRPIDALADVELAPDKGSSNPFTERVRSGGPHKYTAYVVFNPPPERRETNTIYAGAMEGGLPNPSGFLIYRVYVSDDPEDPAGMVPLPTVTLDAPGGVTKLQFGQCEPLPPSDGGTINNLMRESDFPDAIPRVLPFPGTTEEPRFRRFYGPDREIRERFPSNPVTDAMPYVNSGFYANLHIAYLYVRISRDWGDVFVFRTRAPTFPDTRAGTDVTAPRQVRYFSICQNELATQRVAACIPDHEIVVDSEGYFTFVISDPSDRPSRE